MSRELQMADTTEVCSGCRHLLKVPPDAKTIRCWICGRVTKVRRRDHVWKAKRWVKSIIALYSNNYNPAYSPTTSSSSFDGGGGSSSLVRPPNNSTVHGKKRALLVGISYTGKSYELKGTVNDVDYMKFLLNKCGFRDEFIHVLTEKERDPRCFPTRRNMLEAMRRLVNDCREGDSLVFHFSGHGSQQFDVKGDEKDGFDETLCPLDYEVKGMIVDDEINDIMVRPLPKGVKLHAIIDSCHSGTALDLPYLCRMNRNGRFQWEDHSPSSGNKKGTSGGLAISISGCDDHQTSADTTALSGVTTTGAMTYAFIKALEDHPSPSYGTLLCAMRNAIREANTGSHFDGPIASLARRVFRNGLTQEPQLCSSEEFNVYGRLFTL